VGKLARCFLVVLVLVGTAVHVAAATEMSGGLVVRTALGDASVDRHRTARTLPNQIAPCSATHCAMATMLLAFSMALSFLNRALPRPPSHRKLIGYAGVPDPRPPKFSH